MSNEKDLTSGTGARFSAFGVGLAVLFATATFFSGVQFASMSQSVSAESQSAGIFSFFSRASKAHTADEADLTEFWRVWELMDEKFAHSSSSPRLTPEEKVDGAIAGMVRAFGDPYTSYLNQTEASAFDEDISGNFGGVGMEVGLRNNIITVIAPLVDTPAAKAGIMAGDAIVSINGTSTENMSVDRAVRLIRGPEGTDVTLIIARSGDTDFREIVITRAQIEIPTVKTERDGDVFIISLYSFNALADMRMQQALREYVESGADKLIIDLRGNPGGYMQSAISLASYFLPTGKVVLREQFGDGGKETVHRSQGRTLKQFAPNEIVVLLDGGSASASEIVGGALQQHGLATIIGTTSFGKGSVQELVPLKSGGSLKVTVARWLTPDGTSISDGGLPPDIRVERTIEDREAELDPQRTIAIEFLRGTYVPTPSTESKEI